ncbi:hypothetical protein [Acidipropionibacterium jensenii]|uniref:Uncharacterized protein n=1 Tax=Acidipropionibacterium jensenii TaxID=1749 RepID=A0A3S4YVB4_9ACTN|nr:hypothetical protein [Acidipropionibacterium jensenii]MDN5978347.1 hypothetical protein [Acidipropionibacterium jensenii]MDN5996522.1 hypothetical protein [Acidipropionibacterium jensenii]MDN6426439.1 hypothetical protein [Acidipropionibacterium jensenii]MDN6441117.1 hypothetical protein [Acidipropionibacterium jensenii]MDN6514181.1 hypothetical protein [Acidipropionibacterium jensenii]
MTEKKAIGAGVPSRGPVGSVRTGARQGLQELFPEIDRSVDACIADRAQAAARPVSLLTGRDE